MKNIKIRYYLEAKASNPDERTKPELIMAEINYGYAVINNQGKKRYTPVRFSLQENTIPLKFGKKEENFKFNEEVFKKSNKNNATIKTKMLQFEGVLNELANEYILKIEVPTPKELTTKLASRLR
jgi:tRNA G10  N-methylase Trm11